MKQSAAQIHADEKIRSAPAYQKLLKEITTIDEFGFEFKPWRWWITEEPGEELRRLQLNQDMYVELINGGHQFPVDTRKARSFEYQRILELKGLLKAA